MCQHLRSSNSFHTKILPFAKWWTMKLNTLYGYFLFKFFSYVNHKEIMWEFCETYKILISKLSFFFQHFWSFLNYLFQTAWKYSCIRKRIIAKQLNITANINGTFIYFLLFQCDFFKSQFFSLSSSF